MENSIHHAARDPHTPLHIAVTALREGEACVITVADDGIGIPPERLAVMRAVIAGEAPPEAMEAKGSGIGIANVSQRIAEFYGAHAIFAIESELGRGTRCHIRIQPGGMNTW